MPNNSPDFSQIPPGIYTIVVDAGCSNGTITKTTQVTISGSYVAPVFRVDGTAPTLSCGNYGKIILSMSGKGPLNIQFIGHPANYTGPTIIPVTSTTLFTINDLPAGQYRLQLVDACASATPVQSVTISTMSGASPSPTNPYLQGTTCRELAIRIPNLGVGGLLSLYEVAYSIDQGPISPYKSAISGNFIFPIPSGKTIKDYYSKSINYYIKDPCGTISELLTSLSTPSLHLTYQPYCHNGFYARINISPANIVCFPVTLTVREHNTGSTYGPFTITDALWDMPLLTYGRYSFNIVTADGHNLSRNMDMNPPAGQHTYQIRVNTDASGLHNYAPGFILSDLNGAYLQNGTVIELTHGPAGYSYRDTVKMTGLQSAIIRHNQAPHNNTNRYYPPGDYTWRVTDVCGTYAIPIKIGDTDVRKYSLDVSNTRETCEGLTIYPKGSSTYKNHTFPGVYFEILHPYQYRSMVFQGDSLTLPRPGTYLIGIAHASVSDYGNNYQNAYQIVKQVSYNAVPFGIDINNTQAFICKGSLQGQVIARAKGGMPFNHPSRHYKYALAGQGQGLNGPYIATNTTGIFTPANMMANQIYEIKIEDSCGAFVVQPIKVLDLSQAALANANGTMFCAGDSILLEAIPMPDGNYTWTGPNGFTSNLRMPVINKAEVAHSGQYNITITTPYCNIPATYSLDLIVHPSPDKAVVVVSCTDTSALLTANPVGGGATYQWHRDDVPIPNATTTSYNVQAPGTYILYTIFSSTGCKTPSDPFRFTTRPGFPPVTTIVPDAHFICSGESATLRAVTTTPVVSYQWYADNMPVNGATNDTYVTSTGGSFHVVVNSGPCSDTISATVIIRSLSPEASLTAAGPLSFCENENVLLQANKGSGLRYTWQRDGETIPLENKSVHIARESGVYRVKVGNDACTTISDSLTITVYHFTKAILQPSGDTALCEGNTIKLRTADRADYTHRWQFNNKDIPNAVNTEYTAGTTGIYQVIVTNDYCPPDTSATLLLKMIPYPDTTVTIFGPDRFCTGDSVLLAVQDHPAWQYAWRRDQNLIHNANGPVYFPKTSGLYTVDITNKGCNASSAPIQITVDPTPQPEIKRMNLELSTGHFDQYQWILNNNPIQGSTNRLHTIYETGYYKVIVTDEITGCSGISDIFFVASLTEPCILRLPGAFSPNGDGKNDVFRPITTDGYHIRAFRVMNRWGQTLFNAYGSTTGWDGTFNGSRQEQGTYFYHIEYICNSGSVILSRQGEVMLMR